MARSGGASHRLFVAVPLPAGLEDFVTSAQALLPRASGVRLMGLDQLHVTLAFIGTVGEQELCLAREVVETVPSDMGGEVRLGGFRFIPSAKKPRVVALDIADQGEVLSGLQCYVADRLESAGVGKREKRPFRAHLTVARLRTPGAVQPTSEGGSARFAVESVCLYESDLRREGAKYEVLARAALDGAGARSTA